MPENARAPIHTITPHLTTPFNHVTTTHQTTPKVGAPQQSNASPQKRTACVFTRTQRGSVARVANESCAELGAKAANVIATTHKVELCWARKQYAQHRHYRAF